MNTFEHTITVNVPVHTAYNQWTQFESFPHFMEGIERVEQLSPTETRWYANIAGIDRAWSAEITEQVPDERITWNSLYGVNNNGTITFESLDANTTRINLRIDYEPANLLETIGTSLGIFDGRVKSDLGNFKQFIEQRGEATGAWRGEIQDGELETTAQ